MYPDPNLIPIAKADVEGVEPGATTDILAADITPSKPPSTFRINYCIDAACKFSAIVTVDSTAYTVTLNKGANVVAAGSYVEDLLVASGDSVNFQISSNETVTYLRVQEIPSSL